MLLRLSEDNGEGFGPLLFHGEELMSKRIPIATAKHVAEKHDLSQVLLIGWDGENVHVVTYGKGRTKEEVIAKLKEAAQ